MDGNSWDILNAILGNKYHQTHSNMVISSEWSQYLQQRWLWLQFAVCKWVSPQYTIDCFADISTQKLDLDQMC